MALKTNIHCSIFVFSVCKTSKTNPADIAIIDILHKPEPVSQVTARREGRCDPTLLTGRARSAVCQPLYLSIVVVDVCAIVCPIIKCRGTGAGLEACQSQLKATQS